MAHLRIEQSGSVAKDTKIVYVDGDTETDLSACVSSIKMDMRAGEATRKYRRFELV